MGNEEDHPALIIDHQGLPGLTLALPDGLEPGPLAGGLLKAFRQTRVALASRFLVFNMRAAEYAAGGDMLRQALCRGQALGAKCAMTTLDEEIIEAFGLWPQYEQSGRNGQ